MDRHGPVRHPMCQPGNLGIEHQGDPHVEPSPGLLKVMFYFSLWVNPLSGKLKSKLGVGLRSEVPDPRSPGPTPAVVGQQGLRWEVLETRSGSPRSP